MSRLLFVSTLVGLFAMTARADVTSEASRRENLLEYIASRDDLTKDERAAWDKAIRLEFGGKALKDGSDEGVTVAKSVVSGAIFYRIDPKKAAKAAYDAYHDTYRWVPPPIAINYQILAFQGKKPKAAARQLAFNFPRYFNEEIAPDLVTWWDEMLAKGQIPDAEKRQVEEALAETRKLMRPMLRDKLWLGAEIEARASNGSKELRDELDALQRELERDFKKVAQTAPALEGKRSFYERYAALSKELSQTPRARPVPEPKPQVAKPTPPPTPPATKEPSAKDARGKAPKVEQQAEARPEPKAEPEAPRPPPDYSGIAEARPERESPPPSSRGSLLQPPYPGDPLILVSRGYDASMSRSVDGWVGTPYLFGGMDKRGIDCSAFVREVFKESISVELPRNSRSQALLGDGIRQNELKPGDMVFFDTLDRGRITHVGVYLGDGMFAHASSSKGVTRAKLEERYYQKAYRTSRRILTPQ